MIGTRRMSPLMEITFLAVTFLFTILAAKGMYNITELSTQESLNVLGISYQTFNAIMTVLLLLIPSIVYIKVIKGMGTKSAGVVFILTILGFFIIVPMATLSSIGVLGKYSLTNTLEKEVAMLESKASINITVMNKSREYFQIVREDLKGDITLTHQSAIENIKKIYRIVDRDNANSWNSFNKLGSLLNFFVFIPFLLTLMVLFIKAIKAGRPKDQKIHHNGMALS